MSKANDYLESLFVGIDTIIDKRFETLAYDKTIVCTIVDNSNSKNGEYKVSTGDVIYTAYSDTGKYSSGDQVRVSIPMGDYTQKKFIVGKYATDNDSTPLTYVSPLDTVLNISGNLVTELTEGIVANGEKKEKIIWNQKFEKGSELMNLQDTNIYNTIILKAQFKTLFNNYDLISGNYGIRLDFLVSPSANSKVNIRRYVELDSSEMFGNPYCFSIYSTQAKVVKLNTIGIVKGLELTLYQKGNFVDRTRGSVKPINKNVSDDILIRNIEIGLGCDLEKLEDNTLQIYTENELEYRYNQHDNTTNLKKMGLLWFNKDDNNQYIGFSDGIYSSNYDELTYLKKSQATTRLLNQKGREGIPTTKKGLTLAANIEEAYPLIQNAIKVADSDLTSLLQDFSLKVQDVESYVLAIDNAIDAIGTSTATLYDLLDKDSSNQFGLSQSYAKILNYTYEIQNEKEHKKSWNSNWLGIKKGENRISYGQLIAQEFYAIINTINILMSTNKANENKNFYRINSEYSGLKSAYDSYKIRINRILAVMKGYLGKLDSEIDKDYMSHQKSFPEGVIPELSATSSAPLDYSKLKNLGRKDGADVAKETLKIYVEPDYSADDNKYCIYWFRYEQDYEAPEDEQILPSGWRRLQPDDFFKEITLTANKYQKNKYYIFDEDKNRYKKCSDDAFNSSKTYYKKNPKCYVDEKDGINVGLSEKYKDDDGNDIKNSEGKCIHAPRPEHGVGFLNIYMQNDWEEEKYKAVLFYNHDMYISNEITFKNKDVIPDKTTLDKGDILIFEHLDKSTPSYYSYDVTYHLMNRSDEHVDRCIRCHYDGLLAKDNALVSGQIYWYIPGQSTMLTFDREDLEAKGFVLDDERSERGWQEVKDEDFRRDNKVYEPDTYYKLKTNGKYELWTDAANESNPYNKPDTSDDAKYYEKIYKKYCFYKTVSAKKIENPPEDAKDWDKWDYTNGSTDGIDNRDFWYKIKPIYSDSATENVISCVFIKNKESDAVKGDEIFNFGIKGTAGTKYTLTVENRTTQNVATSDDGLKLKCAITDCDNKTLDFVKTFNNSFTITWLGYKKQSGSEGSTPGQNYTESSKEATFNTPKGYYGILKLNGKISLVGTDLESEENKDGKKREIDLTVYHDVPYSTGNYVLDGPTQIIYNGLGTIDDNSLYNNPYKLKAKKSIQVEIPSPIKSESDFKNEEKTKYIWNSKDKKYEEIKTYNPDIEEYFILKEYKAGDIIDYVDWSVEYFKQEDGVWTSLSTTKTQKPAPLDNEYYPSEAEYCSSYMPKIEGNNLKPAPLYMSDLNCYAVVVATVGKKIKYRQPLIIFQNKYGSTMLNNWDGTFQIDEENGTIMGTMFGAGKKTSNNTFEGVLMGDVATGAGITQGFDNQTDQFGLSNHTGIGIYGFNDGAQSFGLNVDGTAFFGKSGKGRIIFNGNHGVIASSNWFTGIDTYDADGVLHENKGKINFDGSITPSNDGMCIDLESGHIDAYNFKVTSKNIYLNSNPSETDTYNGGNAYYVRIGSDGTAFKGQIDQKQTRGYIGLTTSGDLDIRVNKLTLTEQLGGENLLRQTSPSKNALQYAIPTEEQITAFNKKITDKVISVKNKKIDGKYYKISSDELTYYYEMDSTYKKYLYSLDEDGNYLYERTDEGALIYYWNTNSELKNPSYCQWTPNSKAKTTGKESEDDKKRYVGITYISSSDTPKSYIITQKVEDLVDDMEYTLSGWVQVTSVSGDFKATLKQSGTDTELEKTKLTLNTGIILAEDLSTTDWIYFEKNVKLPAGKTAIDVQFSYAKPFKIYHAKLEEGNTATEWGLSEWDIDNNVETTKDNFSQYLSQEEIFKKLSTNPQTGQLMDGIWLEPNSLTGTTELYMCATYIATGILRSREFDGKVSYNAVNDKYSIDVVGATEGMYLNLDEGFIWGKKFDLSGGDDNGSIIIKTGPENSTSDYYFYTGNSDNHISLNGSGGLDLKSQSFTLTSGDDVYISDTGTSMQFKFGEETSSISDIVLKMGKTFGVTSGGTVYATNVNLTGNIYANYISAGNGTIAGWTVGADSIHKGNMYLNSNGTNGSISAGYASIDSSGYLEATSATLHSLTITGDLTVEDSEGAAATFVVKSNAEFDRNIQIKGDDNGVARIYGPAGKTADQCIYMDSNQIYIAGKTTSTALASRYIYLGKTADSNSEVVSDVYLRGNLYFDGVVKAYDDGAYHEGVDGTYQIKTGIFKSGKLVFKKGILIKVLDKDNKPIPGQEAGVDTTGGTTAIEFPVDNNNKINYGTSGQVLKTNGKGGVYWANDENTNTDTDTHGYFSYRMNNGEVEIKSGNWGTGWTVVYL